MGPLLHHKGSEWDCSCSNRVNVRVCAIMVGTILLLEHLAESCKFMINLREAQRVLGTVLVGSEWAVCRM